MKTCVVIIKKLQLMFTHHKERINIRVYVHGNVRTWQVFACNCLRYCPLTR